MWRFFIAFFLLAGILPAAGLQIQQAAVQRHEDGPPVLPSESFAAGEVVHFSFFVSGYLRKADAVSVSFDAQPKDPFGLILVPRITGKVQTTLSPEDKEWRPKLRGSFILPSILLPGDYSIEIQTRDDLANTAASVTLPFHISGLNVEPSAGLSVQSLRFYPNDTDERPLDVAAFRVTEEVHVRFIVTGFRHDEKGAFHVSYGITLADPGGHVLFSTPSAAEDQGANLYPKPYVPASLSFSLKPGTPPGEYSFTVNADDLIGHQQTQTRRSFRLE